MKAWVNNKRQQAKQRRQAMLDDLKRMEDPFGKEADPFGKQPQGRYPVVVHQQLALTILGLGWTAIDDYKSAGQRLVAAKSDFKGKWVYILGDLYKVPALGPNIPRKISDAWAEARWLRDQVKLVALTVNKLPSGVLANFKEIFGEPFEVFLNGSHPAPEEHARKEKESELEDAQLSRKSRWHLPPD